MKELYVVSKQRVTYMQDKKIKWIYSFKNANDYKEVIKYLNEFGVRYSISI